VWPTTSYAGRTSNVCPSTRSAKEETDRVRPQFSQPRLETRDAAFKPRPSRRFLARPTSVQRLPAPSDVALRRLEDLLPNYRPGKGTSWGIPKANFTVRDSIQITPLDRIVYQALIDRLIPHVDPKLSPCVYSSRLRVPARKWIFKPKVAQFKSFLSAARQALRHAPGSFLVTADVAQYFESIRFRDLRKQLENVLGNQQRGAMEPCISALFECLHEWSPYDGYGLVQNVDASSFLGNVLLDYVDKRMDRDGYRTFRYMDDIRIVVPTEADGRRALVKLVSYLRDLGLGLNAAKTKLIPPSCRDMEAHLIEEDRDIANIENAIGRGTRAATQGVVDVLFAKTRDLIGNDQVGERVFRFCLNRIASLRATRDLLVPAGEDITDSVLKLLVYRPAETDTFCRYLEVAPLTELHKAELRRLLTQECLCIYPWQNFLLWRLASQLRLKCPELTRKAHQVLGEPTSPDAAGAALYLGEVGDYADRSAIARLLRNAPQGLIQRCYQLGIQEMHKAERRPVYTELSGRDAQAAILTDHIMSLSRPIYVESPPEISIRDLPDAMPSVYA
jgi:hypothetical protein